ncbi:hypothetical protein LN042_09150 [Kitasatospora sp. RB6PN24]|uniref:hypothetical protein n=1 Tax=Kitasatospora humi TaxID=2893891 RepID=UPI001E41FF39|nr:hypothetical protein [Kitasatospora humi]MCC9307266.1 hypothetical protein [Kitasatospora humi]
MAIQLTAIRTQNTLPEVPDLGLTYVSTLDLFHADGSRAGSGVASSAIVDLTPSGPVVLSQIVLTLAGGELQYQRVIDRFGSYPRTAAGAILGGTGKYRGSSGDVEITWPDEDRIELTIKPVR